MIKRIPIVIVVIACLLPFIRLGTGEILPWDESLYTVRADACLKFGAWLDQTKYAIGGLYSASHPPFGVWLIAISKLVLGNSTFAAKFPIAIAASLSIIFLWWIVKRFASESAALIAIASLSASDLFLVYSQRAQMESLILCLSLGTIYFLVKAIDRDQWWLAILSGIIFGLGLLTKFGYILAIAPIVVLLPWAIERTRGYRYLGMMISLGFLIFLPWLWIMSSNHPDFLDHIRASVGSVQEGNYQPEHQAWWYYWNRLFVALPAIVIVPFINRPDRKIIAVAIWLFSILVLLQFFQTRMSHFATLLLAPGSILIGFCWEEAGNSTKWKRLLLSLFLVLTIGWSVNEQFRYWIANRISWNDIHIPTTGIVVVIVMAFFATIVYFVGDRSKKLSLSFSMLLMGVAIAHPFSLDRSELTPGASDMGHLALSLPQKSSIVVIHRDFPHEQYAPQLAYYTSGWTLGWIPEKTSHTFTWGSAATSAYIPDSSKEIAVIVRFEDRYYHRPPAEVVLWDLLTNKLRRSFSHEQDFRSYYVFY